MMFWNYYVDELQTIENYSPKTVIELIEGRFSVSPICFYDDKYCSIAIAAGADPTNVLSEHLFFFNLTDNFQDNFPRPDSNVLHKTVGLLLELGLILPKLMNQRKKR